MLVRLAATVMAAILILLATPTGAGASLSPPPGPDKCPMAAKNILDHCD